MTEASGQTSEAPREPNQILDFQAHVIRIKIHQTSMLREPQSRNQMRSTARNHERFDPGLGINNLDCQNHSKRRFHRITITFKLETLYLAHNCRTTCFSRRGVGLSCASSCHLSNTIQRSTTVQHCMPFRHGHGDTRVEFRRSLSIARPSTFQNPRMLETHRHQKEVWKKSRSVWLEACRHQLVDILPRSDLLHHTIDTGFETQGAVS